MIVSIVSKKGGVGKTTTAVSLGAALAAQGRRVLSAADAVESVPAGAEP